MMELMLVLVQGMIIMVVWFENLDQFLMLLQGVCNEDLDCICMVKLQMLEEVIKVKMMVCIDVLCSQGSVGGGVLQGCEEIFVCIQELCWQVENVCVIDLIVVYQVVFVQVCMMGGVVGGGGMGGLGVLIFVQILNCSGGGVGYGLFDNCSEGDCWWFDFQLEVFVMFYVLCVGFVVLVMFILGINFDLLG